MRRRAACVANSPQRTLGGTARSSYPNRMHVISVSALTKRYGETLAVDDIGFDVAAGTTVGLLGGNGAGKTTTIAMLLGLLIPTAGSVRVLGADMLRHRYRVLPPMNFPSPYVDLPNRMRGREILVIYAHL